MIKKAIKHLLLFSILLLACLSIGQYAGAKTVISDNAHLLTTEEAELIRERCDTILDRYDTSVYIVTSDSIGKHDSYESYMEQIGNAEDAPENMVLLFISTKEKGHVYQIYGYGIAETQLNEKRCNKVMDHMQRDLTQGNYYDALDTFCIEVLGYMGRNPKLDFFLFQSIPQLILCLLLSLLIIFLMLRSTKGKNTTTVRTYLDAENSKLLGRMDHFRHMSVTRVKKPDTQSHSGGGSGSGRSHSSGKPHSF